MVFIDKLRKMISDYEDYVKDFPDNKLIFKMILAELTVLEQEYFKDIQSEG